MASAVSDADYVCTLDDKSAKKAKDELNEDPKNRLSAVQKFRELILQQPHIKCPTGIQLMFDFATARSDRIAVCQSLCVSLCHIRGLYRNR